MDWVTLRSIHRKQPFKPYKIQTSAGDSYRVPHPESLSVTGNEQAVAIQYGAADFDIVDLASITAISPLYPGHSATASEAETETD